MVSARVCTSFQGRLALAQVPGEAARAAEDAAQHVAAAFMAGVAPSVTAKAQTRT